jgi:DNA polymerase-3 subunit alpha
LGIKPIIGLEAYVVDNRKEKSQVKEKRFHLTLLAENNTGYQNLIQISSRGFLEGYYYKPRIDMEVLRQQGQGIICLTGCLNSRLCHFLYSGDKDSALTEVRNLQSIFGEDNVYIEIQFHGLAEQEKVNPLLVELAAEVGRPLVATNDVHYLRKEDATNHDALLCIQTGSTLLDADRLKFQGDEFYLKSAAEMAAAFPEVPEALASTVEIAKRCNVEMEFGKLYLPVYKTPGDIDQDKYLRQLCEEGFARRYLKEGEPKEARERLEFELATIKEMGFASYFLIVWDFVKYAKKNGIAVGPGRGSAAGSLVAYCLGITEIDPLKYDLLFERFLNPGRRTMPDIDIDFSPEDREKVIAYVAEKYGRQNVAQIITFGTFAARGGTRDAGRVMGVPYGTVDKIAKLIPEGPGVTFASCLEEGQDLRLAYEEDPQTKQIVDLGRFLEGMVRHDSIHAAGVVISDRPLTERVPLQQKGDAEVVTQFAMEDVEALGLLKMDFLGLRNLDIIKNAVRLIKENHGVEIDPNFIPLDDEKTYEMLRRGQSDAVFQFESSGMKESLRLVGPTCFEDLVAIVALFRPGPMQYIAEFASNKKSPGRVKYDDPRLQPILGPTYGVAIYQEQLMEIAKVMAGFSPAEADDLRKAIAKKKRGLLASLKNKFVAGCQKNKVAPRVVEKLWRNMEAAGDYSFNKSHAVGYALIAYQTAFLKANYPKEYMAATISSVMSTKDKVPFYVNVAADMGIEVLPPDVNESMSDFSVVSDRIRFGLTAVKHVGSAVIASVIAAREKGGPFTSIFDFCRRVDSNLLNKKALESLIKSGALDSTGATRKGMLKVMAKALSMGAQSQQDSVLGQASIFDLAVEDENKVADPPIPEDEFAPEDLMRLEKQTLGLYVSSHPLKGLMADITSMGAVSTAALKEVPDKANVTVAGMVSKVKRLTTKKGDPMAFVVVEDLEGSVEVVVFSELFYKCKHLLTGDRVIMVKGKVDQKDENEVKIVAFEVSELVRRESEGRDAGSTQKDLQLSLNVDLAKVDPELVDSVKSLCRQYRGGVPVVLNMNTAEGTRRLKLGQEYHVELRTELLRGMEHLFGSGGVQLIPLDV